MIVANKIKHLSYDEHPAGKSIKNLSALLQYSLTHPLNIFLIRPTLFFIGSYIS